MSRLPLLFALITVAALTACASLRGTAGAGGGGTSKNCKSCERMCELAGDAQENPASVAKCKTDCRKKCS